MINLSGAIAYVLYVVLFSLLFKYGIQLSFGIDPGYVGPAFIFHAVLMFVALLSQGKK